MFLNVMHCRDSFCGKKRFTERDNGSRFTRVRMDDMRIRTTYGCGELD